MVNKIVGWGALLAAVLVSMGCGSIDMKPSKPAAITVDGVDIKRSSSGQLEVSRKGEIFRPCEKDCKLYNERVEIESVKTKTLEHGCSGPVTILRYQVPVVDIDEESTPYAVGRPNTLSGTPGSIQPNLMVASIADLAGNNVIAAQDGQFMLLAQVRRHKPKKQCLEVSSLLTKNNCCTFTDVSDDEGVHVEVPHSDDPDCAVFLN